MVIKKARQVGRHGERHTGSVLRARDVPDSRRDSRGGSRKKKKQVLLTKPIVLVCSNHGRNDGAISKDGIWLFVRTWKAHHTMYRWPPRQRLPLSATIHFNSTLQCCRSLGYLDPYNPGGWTVAVPALFLVLVILEPSGSIGYYRWQ